MAISIDFLANVNDVLRGTKNVEGALDDVAGSLDELARDADRDADKIGRALEDGIKDGASDSERAVEKLERSFKELADTAKRETRQAGDSIDRNLDRGLKASGEGLDEFKDEAASTAREAAASFDGSAESIGDAFQEVAANAFPGFGPAGAAAGIAAAVGLGVVFSEMQKQQEAAEALKQAMGDMYREAVEAGRTYIDEAQIIAEVNDIMFNPDKETVYQQAKRDAEVLGVTLSDILFANAGEEESLNKVREAGKQLAEEQLEVIAEGGELVGAQNREYGDIISKYEMLGELHDENNERAKLSLDLEGELSAKQRESIEQGRRASQERYEELERLYKKAGSPPQPVIRPRIDTSDLDQIERWINALNGRAIHLRVRGEGMDGRQIF